jgi:hypothetical protein
MILRKYMKVERIFLPSSSLSLLESELSFCGITLPKESTATSSDSD